VSLAKTLGVLSFTPLTMLQACAQAVDFKVGHHFGVDKGMEHYDQRYRDQQIQSLKKKAAKLGLQLLPALP
jgi:hypothetical protein